MSYCLITALSTVEVEDHKNLLGVWPTYKDPHKLLLISSFIVKKPLTASQRRRLPAGLRDRLRLK
jgi:hypothetical protein